MLHFLNGSFENLCKNAIDAMAGVGHINICVRQRGAVVNIEVSDTGKGISKKRWKRVFKPGFTTKRRGWGIRFYRLPSVLWKNITKDISL